MTPPTCVITGGTSGIGRAAALALGSQGAHVIVVGRNARRGAKTVARIRRQSRTATAEFYQCDLSARADVVALARAIAGRNGRIDVLINNAGARFDTFGAGPDGIERTFAGNYLGHFLLTVLLLDTLLRAPAARVITVGSGAHMVTPPDGWILDDARYDRKLAYGSSKLATIIFAYELARRLEATAITSNALDPGGVATRLGQNNGAVAWLKHIGFYLGRGELVSSRTAATGLTYLATSDDVARVTGQYFRGKRTARSSDLSYDPRMAHDLWERSVEYAGLTPSAVGAAWQYVRP